MKFTIIALSNLLTGTAVALVFTGIIAFKFVNGEIALTEKDYVAEIAEGK